MIVNALLTRKCNLDCKYCNIVKNYPDMPSMYPKVGSYKEIPGQDWLDFFVKLKQEDPDLFVILYGGEPVLYKDFDFLVKNLYEQQIPFTVITNATLPDKILSNIDYIDGLTCSVDPILFAEDNYDQDRLSKSSAGLKLLTEVSEKYPEKDLVAEVVIDKRNWLYLPNTVKYLSQHGIWSSLSLIEGSKSKYYDFAAPLDSSLEIDNKTRQKLTDMIIDLIFKDKYLIHAPEAVLKTLNHVPDKPCNVHTTLDIEPDGRMRLCLRIHGIATEKYTIYDYFEKKDQFKEARERDMRALCKGCSWTCKYMYNVVHKGRLINSEEQN